MAEINVLKGYLPLNEGRLYVETCLEEGDVPLLFLHGFTLDSVIWKPQVDYFTQCRKRSHIVVDLMGFGRSDLPVMASEGMRYHHFDHIHSVLNAKAVEQVHLVGMSMGGGIAIEYAIAHPERVASMTLLGSVCHGQPWSESWIESLKAIGSMAREAGVDSAKMAWRRHPVFSGVQMDTAGARLLLATQKRYSGWHWLNRDPVAYLDPLACDRLGEIQCPVLAIIGESDIDDFKWAATMLSKQLGHKQCWLDRLPEVGHLPSLEVPDQINKRIAQFLDYVEKGRVC